MTNLRLPIDGVFCVMEIWKDIPNYEGIYQVSNLGRVKSLGNDRNKKERMRKERIHKGYSNIMLSSKNVQKSFDVHQLVAMAFLGHIPCGHKLEVDHINGIKTDNSVDNLQVITHRENAFRIQGKYSSKYKGVSWCKHYLKWKSSIYYDNKFHHLGYFESEEKARDSYIERLKQVS